MFFSRIDTVLAKGKTDHRQCEQACDICFKSIGMKPFIDSVMHPRQHLLCSCCCAQLRIKKFYREDLSVKTCVLFEYRDFIRNLILRYKVHNDDYLKRYLFEYHRLWIRLHYVGYHYVIAPSHQNTTKSSKKNHLENLVENIGLKCSGINLINTAPIKQAQCNAQQRCLIRNHIQLEKVLHTKTKKILIIDDIVTTGNTLETIAGQLSPYVNQIEALCLAGTLPNHK